MTIIKGESLSIAIVINNYDKTRIVEKRLYIGSVWYPLIEEDNMLVCRLTSQQTDSRGIGRHHISLWLDDTILGVRKPELGDIIVMPTGALKNTESESSIYNLVYTLDIIDDEITVDDVLYNYFKGDNAFRVWQLQAGNEGKTYDDYISFLQKPATDAANLAAEATDDAIAAASLANEKAELANAKATLADQKATLANNAATLANEKAALADTATTNSNNAEMQRVTAESGRVTAEGNRVTAENNRVTVEGNRVTAEQGRVTAETTRTMNETSRVTAEGGRITAESGRVTAETGRTTAETARVSAENARNVASNAYNLTVQVPLGSGYYTLATAVAAVVVDLRKKGLVITFESAAGVWETYQFTGASTATWTTLNQWVKETNQLNVTELLELPVAEVLNVLYAKIQVIEAFIKTSQYGNVTADQVDIVRNFNVWGKTNLIIEGVAAPAVVPDFVGQQFINTVGGVTYTAKGNTSVADWKQTSN